MPATNLRSPAVEGAGRSLARKLNAFARLSREDAEALDRVARNIITVDARRDLIREGDAPKQVHLVLDGWAARYKRFRTASDRSLACSSRAISAISMSTF